MAIGSIGVLMIVLAFTDLPFKAHRALAIDAGLCHDSPDLIVVLGGSGMPSGPELLRLHHAASEAADRPSATLLVVHPEDTAVMQEMVAELELKGVRSDRIMTLPEGRNTREQAMAVHRTINDPDRSRVAIVTAPENMYRTLLSFRKAGIDNVCGVPAFDHAMFIDLDYDHTRAGGSRIVPDISANLDLRYNFWNYLKLEITCLREYVAIAYYWINGWI